MKTKSAGGRPPAYSESQLLEAIDALEARGEPVTAGKIKDLLVNQFGLSPGINEQSLGSAIDEMLVHRERRQRAALIASLSPQARAAGTDFAREATDSFLVAIASELATVRREADDKVADVEDDCKQKRTMFRDLREAIDSRDELLETQRRQMRDLETDLAAASEPPLVCRRPST